LLFFPQKITVDGRPFIPLSILIYCHYITRWIGYWNIMYGNGLRKRLLIIKIIIIIIIIFGNVMLASAKWRYEIAILKNASNGVREYDWTFLLICVRYVVYLVVGLTSGYRTTPCDTSFPSRIWGFRRSSRTCASNATTAYIDRPRP